jgi:hypothetical protein
MVTQEKKCIDCNKNISIISTRCKSCSNINRTGTYHLHRKPYHIKNPPRGERASKWKGEKVGYKGLHKWIRQNKPLLIMCENCGEQKSYDLANISGEYKRDINDFKWLCRSCHIKEDGRINNLLNQGVKN